MNFKKSDLVPTQDLVYIGARFRMDLSRVYLLEDWIDGLLALVRSFSKGGQYRTVLLFLGLLGLMGATLQSVEYAHLHMRPIQWYLKQRWNHITHRLWYRILVSRHLNQVLSGGWSGNTFPRVCPFLYPTPPSLSLRMLAWRDGAATADCQGRPRHSSKAL